MALRPGNFPATLMRPLYDARISDLGPHDFVGVECASGHDEMIPRVGLLVGLRRPASMKVLDLRSRFRCRECDRRGSVLKCACGSTARGFGRLICPLYVSWELG